MKEFKTKMYGSTEEYEFLCYENTEHISIGDRFLFFFAGQWFVGVCSSENEEFEINENNYITKCAIDYCSGFWKNCYKISQTNYKFED